MAKLFFIQLLVGYLILLVHAELKWDFRYCGNPEEERYQRLDKAMNNLFVGRPESNSRSSILEGRLIDVLKTTITNHNIRSIYAIHSFVEYGETTL